MGVFCLCESIMVCCKVLWETYIYTSQSQQRHVASLFVSLAQKEGITKQIQSNLRKWHERFVLHQNDQELANGSVRLCEGPLHSKEAASVTMELLNLMMDLLLCLFLWRSEADFSYTAEWKENYNALTKFAGTWGIGRGLRSLFPWWNLTTRDCFKMKRRHVSNSGDLSSASLHCVSQKRSLSVNWVKTLHPTQWQVKRQATAPIDCKHAKRPLEKLVTCCRASERRNCMHRTKTSILCFLPFKNNMMAEILSLKRHFMETSAQRKTTEQQFVADLKLKEKREVEARLSGISLCLSHSLFCLSLSLLQTFSLTLTHSLPHALSLPTARLGILEWLTTKVFLFVLLFFCCFFYWWTPCLAESSPWGLKARWHCVPCKIYTSKEKLSSWNPVRSRCVIEQAAVWSNMMRRSFCANRLWCFCPCEQFRFAQSAHKIRILKH